MRSILWFLVIVIMASSAIGGVFGSGSGVFGGRTVNETVKLDSIDLMEDSTLTRTSVAFLDGVSHAANTKRIGVKSSVSYSDFTIVTDPSGVDVDLIPWCKVGDYVYATDNTSITTTGYRGIYRTKDGVNWETIVDTADLYDMASLKPGNEFGLLYMVATNGNLYSTDPENITWTGDADLIAGEHMTFTTDTLPEVWNWHEADGQIITGEYTTGGGAVRLYRTQDGTTWSTIYVEGDLIDNAVAVDKGAGKVGIPSTGHSFSSGDLVWVRGTTNYDNDSPSPAYTVDATTTANEIVITATYAAETFAGTETVSTLLHSHGVGYHAATDKWFVAWGDGDSVNKVTVSSNDGTTWADWDTNTDLHFQPIVFHDYGSDDYLLAGSDAVWSVAQMDIANVLIKSVLQQTKSTDSAGAYNPEYVFDLFEHDNVIYAAGYNGGATADAYSRAGIFVSDDTKNWQAFHSFNNGEWGVLKFIGEVGGKIVVQYQETDGSRALAYFTAATITDHDAIAIDPPATNLLTDSSRSGCEVNSAGWTAFGTPDVGARVETEYHTSPACFEYSDAAGLASDPLVTTFTISGTSHVTGDMIFGSIAMKCGDLTYNPGGLFRVTLGGGPYSPLGAYYGVGINDEWVEHQVCFEIIDDAAVTENLNFYLSPHGITDALNRGPFQVFYDTCFWQRNTEPSRYVEGGTPRTYEKLSTEVKLPVNWTNEVIWTSYSEYNAYKASYGKQYIKTWYVDSNNYVELYWDASSQFFGIQATVGGVAQTAIETSDTYRIMQDQPVKFYIQYDGALRLTVASGGQLEHLSGAGNVAFSDVTMTSQTGNGAGDAVISGWVLSDTLYRQAMNAGMIEDIASGSSTSSLYTKTADGAYVEIDSPSSQYIEIDVLGLDLTSIVKDYTLYTVPVGKSFYPTTIILTSTAYTEHATSPILSVGSNLDGYDNWISEHTFNFATTGEYISDSATSAATVQVAGDIVKLRVDTAAGNTCTVNVELLGVLQ